MRPQPRHSVTHESLPAKQCAAAPREPSRCAADGPFMGLREWTFAILGPTPGHGPAYACALRPASALDLRVPAVQASCVVHFACAALRPTRVWFDRMHAGCQPPVWRRQAHCNFTPARS